MLETMERSGMSDAELQLTQDREALKRDLTKEATDRWETSLMKYVNQEIKLGAHEVVVELPGITGSARCARNIVRKLAEAVQADQETIGNLDMLVTEFIDNELEHSLGLTEGGPDAMPGANGMKPELAVTFRARIQPTSEGLDIEFSSEGPGEIPSMDDTNAHQKISSQFRVVQPSVDELILTDPMPNSDATDPLGESGRGFFLLAAYLADGRHGQLRYQRFPGDQHRAILSEIIPKAA